MKISKLDNNVNASFWQYKINRRRLHFEGRSQRKLGYRRYGDRSP